MGFDLMERTGSPKQLGALIFANNLYLQITLHCNLKQINLIIQSDTAQKMTQKSCNIEIQIKLIQEKCESHKYIPPQNLAGYVVKYFETELQNVKSFSILIKDQRLVH